jgi:hypothetical protein
MFWNMSARRGTTFEVAYGRKVSVQRLEALSPVQPITVTGLDSADLTGDGHDDVMAIGDVNGTTASGLVVIPMGAPAPMVSIASDSTCSP